MVVSHVGEEAHKSSGSRPCPPSVDDPIERADDRQSRTIHHVRVDHRRLHVLVTEQFLHGADVGPIFQEVRGERMPERMRHSQFGDLAASQRSLEVIAKSRFMDVMATVTAAARVLADLP